MARRLTGGAPGLRWVTYVVAVLVLAATLAACAQGSSSTSYPSKDITFLVPFKAGGSFDIQARLLAPYIQRNLPRKVNVIVENEPAAGTKVATLKLFDAKPDGYTIGIFNVVALATLYAQGDLGNRNPGDLTALGRVNFAPYILMMNADGRFKSIADMKGQKVRFGATTSAYLQSVLFAQAIGAECVFVRYDGLPEAALALQRGDVDAALANWDSAIKHLEASEGKLKPVVACADQRLKAFPDLPTTKELGIDLPKGLMGLMASQSVVLAPPNLPADVHSVLEQAVVKATNDPAFLADAEKAGYYLGPLSPEETKSVVVSVTEFVKEHKDLLKPPQ